MDYPPFNFLPDFTRQPTRRVAHAIDVLNISAAKQWLQWPDTQPQTVTQWAFSGETTSERAAFTSFFEAVGGRAGIFLMPSYSRDLELAALPAQEATTVLLQGDGYGTQYLTDSFPDRDGRHIFLLCPKNGVHIARVMHAQNIAATSLLTIEPPLPWTVEPGAMVGFARLARFETDDLEFTFGNEEHWSATIATRTVRVRNNVTRDIALVEGPAHRLWRPLVSCHQELKTAARIAYSYAFAPGPAAYATPQSDRPTDIWAAWVASDGVRLAKRTSLNPFTITDSDGVLSRLTTSNIRAAHLSLAFDEDGNEVIAFSRRDETLVEIRGLVSGALARWVFPGFSPQLFQFWTINNEAYDRHDAEIICIYAKQGQAGIFGRFEGENFNTEHLLGAFPNVPLRIEAITITGTTLRITCIDDGHREMELSASFDYLTSTGFHTTFSIGFLERETSLAVTYFSVIANTGYTYVTRETYTEVPAGTDGEGNPVYSQQTLWTAATEAVIDYDTNFYIITTHWLTTYAESTQFWTTWDGNTTH